MKVVLVSMPWLQFDRPSVAIGTLAAYIRSQEPRVEVRCRSEHTIIWSALQEDYELVADMSLVPELVYVNHLYPERSDQVGTAIADQIDAIEKEEALRAESEMRARGIREADIEKVIAVTGEYLESTAQTLAQEADVVGLTTTYSQLFSSLSLAKKIKDKNPQVTTVFGGISAASAGMTLLDEYSFVDYVVTGEGELRLLLLLRELLAGGHGLAPSTGILCRHPVPEVVNGSQCAKPLEITDLDSLPLPDYDEYQALAEEHSILHLLPIEGSRGCWWDQRSPHHRDSSRGCYFCGLNATSGRRDKSIPRITEEMQLQATKYETIRFVFTDNLLRSHGRKSLAEALGSTGITYRFNLELRADVDATDLIELQKAGCYGLQIGVEGLSTSYLTRMNKGTTAIQNLYAMRACYELGIISSSNLLIRFPQATPEEIDETAAAVLRYAICYDPLNISKYCIDMDSAVFNNPESFGVRNIRTASVLRTALPEEASTRLQLVWMDHDEEKPPADWAPVLEACKVCRELHKKLRDGEFRDIPKPLFYFDGGVYLEIIDRRDGFQTYTLNKQMRELYLYCMEIRSQRQIVKRFGDQASEEYLMESLIEPLIENNLIFREGSRYLSLAVAWRPDVAIKRINEARLQH